MTDMVTDPAPFVVAAESLVEKVFGAVSTVKARLLDVLTTGPTHREHLQPSDLAELRPGLIEVLAHHREIVVGMGMIVAPGLLPHERRRLEWWQYAPGREQPSALQVDLNPDSLGFYDYDAAEWFSVPRRTGRRHIVGPYVDAHGTDRYLLTFTAPVLVDGTFLGVVGADVPVSRFERRLLGAWGGRGTELTIINNQGRVVMSNCSHALSGDLLSDPDHSTVRVDLPDVPWHVRVVDRPVGLPIRHG
jgi:hypothetical protein